MDQVHNNEIYNVYIQLVPSSREMYYNPLVKMQTQRQVYRDANAQGTTD